MNSKILFLSSIQLCASVLFLLSNLFVQITSGTQSGIEDLIQCPPHQSEGDGRPVRILEAPLSSLRIVGDPLAEAEFIKSFEEESLRTDREYYPMNYAQILAEIDLLKESDAKSTLMNKIVSVYEVSDINPDLTAPSSCPLSGRGFRGEADGTVCRSPVVRLNFYGHGDEEDKAKDKLRVAGVDVPAVLISGALHGDERLGPLVALELAKWLVDKRRSGKGSSNTYSSEYAKWMLRNRDIWIVPFANVDGYANNKREDANVDPNRDFSYLSKSCWKTFTSKWLDSIIHSRLFQTAITFHSGMRGLTYEWGSFNHATADKHQGPFSKSAYKSTEPPDNKAFVSLAKEMQTAAGTFLARKSIGLVKMSNSKRKRAESLPAVDATQRPQPSSPRYIQAVAELTKMMAPVLPWSSMPGSINDSIDVQSDHMVESGVQAQVHESVTLMANESLMWFYPINTMSELVYPVDGGMEDWSYAGGWEAIYDPKEGTCPRSHVVHSEDGASPAENNLLDEHLRVMTYLVEMDDIKDTPADGYGSSQDVEFPKLWSGHVGRNIRMALRLIEMARPEILLSPPQIIRSQNQTTNEFSRKSPIDWLRSALSLSRSWQHEVPLVIDKDEQTIVSLAIIPVGCFNVSDIKVDIQPGVSIGQQRVNITTLRSYQDPKNWQPVGSAITVFRSTETLKCASIGPWELATGSDALNVYKLQFVIPDLGESLSGAENFHVVVSATFDRDIDDQEHPDPPVPPQAHLVRARTLPNYKVEGWKGDLVTGAEVHQFPRQSNPVSAPLNIVTSKLQVRDSGGNTVTGELLASTVPVFVPLEKPTASQIPVGRLDLICSDQDISSVRCRIRCGNCEKIILGSSEFFELSVDNHYFSKVKPLQPQQSGDAPVMPHVFSFNPAVVHESEFTLNLSSLYPAGTKLAGKVVSLDFIDSNYKRRCAMSPFYYLAEQAEAISDDLTHSKTQGYSKKPDSFLCVFPPGHSLRRFTPSSSRLLKSLKRNFQSATFGRMPASMPSSLGFFVITSSRQSSPGVILSQLGEKLGAASNMQSANLTFEGTEEPENDGGEIWKMSGKLCVPHAPKNTIIQFEVPSNCTPDFFARPRQPSVLDPFAARVLDIRKSTPWFSCGAGSIFRFKPHERYPYVECTLAEMSSDQPEDGLDVASIQSFLHAAICPKAMVPPSKEEAQFSLSQQLLVGSFVAIFFILIAAQVFVKAPEPRDTPRTPREQGNETLRHRYTVPNTLTNRAMK